MADQVILIGVGSTVGLGLLLITFYTLWIGFFPARDVIPLSKMGYITTEPDPNQPVNLPKRLGFNTDDLLANQQGVLSERQRRQLGRRARIGLGCFSMVVIGLLAMMGWIIQDALGQPKGFMVWGAGSAVVLGIMLFELWRRRGEFLPPTANTPVKPLKGSLTKERAHNLPDAPDYFYLYMEDKRLQVNQYIYQSFQAGQHYNLYYIDLLGQTAIISAEQLIPPQ